MTIIYIQLFSSKESMGKETVVCFRRLHRIGENMKRKIIPIIIILAISTALLMAALRRVQMTRRIRTDTHISGKGTKFVENAEK